jgi:hypothetical protein
MQGRIAAGADAPRSAYRDVVCGAGDAAAAFAAARESWAILPGVALAFAFGRRLMAFRGGAGALAGTTSAAAPGAAARLEVEVEVGLRLEAGS